LRFSGVFRHKRSQSNVHKIIHTPRQQQQQQNKRFAGHAKADLDPSPLH